MLTELLELHRGKPPPSEFGKPSQWAKWQEDVPNLLCQRPAKRMGLPLCVMHDVFRRFSVDAAGDGSSLKNTRDPVVQQAIKAAHSLCETMTSAYTDENTRSEDFTSCLDPLIPTFLWVKQAGVGPPSARPGYINRSIYTEGMLHVLRQDKAEPGSSQSDAYMQGARRYELFVETMKGQEALETGLPSFVLCVIGKQPYSVIKNI